MVQRPPVPPRVGDVAPALELPTPEGQQVSLRDYLGRPLLLSFLSHAA